MNDEQFWNIVDSIGWPALASRDERIAFGRIKLDLMRKYPAETMDAFFDVKMKKAGKLYRVIRAYNELHGEKIVSGGDSGDDLIAHVIGSGKAVYDKAMVEPESLIGIDYVESFAYCIPYPSEYGQLQPGFFKERCQQVRENILDIFKNSIAAQPLQAELQTIEDIINKLEADQFVGLPDSEEVGRVMKGMINKVEREIVGTLAELMPLAEALNQNQWAVPNMVSDSKDMI